MNIPIKFLKQLSQKYGYDHIICFATKGKRQYVATYGKTLEECDQAAQFGNKMKDGLGWPEKLHAIPSRVQKLQRQIEELKMQLESAQQKYASNSTACGMCGKEPAVYCHVCTEKAYQH